MSLWFSFGRMLEVDPMVRLSFTGMVAQVGAALALTCALTAPACLVATRSIPPAPAPGAIRIVFVGDSLVHRSADDHGLLTRIREILAQRHPNQTIEVVDAGVNGNRIADIRERLGQDVLDLHPDAVVLYWDSDVSDVDETTLTSNDRWTLRAAYEADLRTVCSRLLASGAYVAMSGPTLIGERPHRRNGKDAQLDAYRAINRRVASNLKVVYIDTRRAFFQGRPRGTPPDVSRGVLTEDGEHLNARGVGIVESLFVRALDGWLRRADPTR
jgi:lysophospholipase L1-like esterase